MNLRGKILRPAGSSCMPEFSDLKSAATVPSLSLTQRLVLLLLVLTSGAGCSLLEPEGRSVATNPLPPIVAPRDAVDLEVFIVDRTVGDPLIGPALWNSLHDLTSTSPQLKQQLAEQGIRIAMSPSRPPHAVQSLLAQSGNLDPTRRTSFQQYVVPAMQPTLLQVTVLEPEVEVQLPGNAGELTKLTNGRCQLQLQASKVDEGWARIDVLPEILHGADVPRYKATAEDWVVDQGQKSILLYDQRFSAELNEGEILVIGYTDQAPDSVGERFFRGQWKNIPIERLLIIRLRGMHRVDPVRAE